MVVCILTECHATMPEDPIILTLQLDEVNITFFNEQRQLYFPPERNFLKAHLTLFHHLPPAIYPQIMQELELLSKQQQPMALAVTEVKFIGKGVAYKMESRVLQQLHLHLQQR